ncbi:MAG TPA: contractile injection system protein, VgrG/Pvc8 family [Pyrinomonadaceae bacterium]|nr:contractile injection system protein, VgrG/Pvc8 family [Pyrinomonadaceae bacterium]
MAEPQLSESTVYRARPTVRIESQEYPKVSELIVGLEMVEREGGMSALELRVTNMASDTEGGADFAFEDDEILKLGARIQVYCGDEDSPQEIFNGKITGLEADFKADAAPELVVLAEDVFQRARMARRTKIHEDVTISGLANDLANQLGLTPTVTGFTDNIGTQVQLNESDLAFLRRLLALYDGDMQVVGTELHVSPRADVQRGQVELELNSQLRRARVLADLAQQVTEVTVSGWDATQGQRVNATSRGANMGPGSGRTGKECLGDTLGDRSEHVGQFAVTNLEEARALADAAFDLRARRFVCVDATADGNPALRVGTHVALSGMGDRFNNTYYVVHARHRFDLTRGYETDFAAESAFWGRA